MTEIGTPSVVVSYASPLWQIYGRKLVTENSFIAPRILNTNKHLYKAGEFWHGTKYNMALWILK